MKNIPDIHYKQNFCGIQPARQVYGGAACGLRSHSVISVGEHTHGRTGERETHPRAEETKCCQPVAEFQMQPKVEMAPYTALLGLKDKPTVTPERKAWPPDSHAICPVLLMLRKLRWYREGVSTHNELYELLEDSHLAKNRLHSIQLRI